MTMTGSMAAPPPHGGRRRPAAAGPGRPSGPTSWWCWGPRASPASSWWRRWRGRRAAGSCAAPCAGPWPGGVGRSCRRCWSGRPRGWVRAAAGGRVARRRGPGTAGPVRPRCPAPSVGSRPRAGVRGRAEGRSGASAWVSGLRRGGGGGGGGSARGGTGRDGTRPSARRAASVTAVSGAQGRRRSGRRSACCCAMWATRPRWPPRRGRPGWCSTAWAR